MIYDIKDGNSSRNLPKPFTPTTIKKASSKEQVRATAKTASFRSPRLRT